MKSRYFPVLIVLLVLGLVWAFLIAKVATRGKGDMAPKSTLVEMAGINIMPGGTETAIFASGCVGDLRGNLSKVGGVSKTDDVYVAAIQKKPVKDDDCFGKSGYTQAVRVHFDPETVSYENLLQGFWALHYPSSLKKQANIGKRCRASIYYTSPAQDMAARTSLQELIRTGKYSRKLTVGIAQAGKVYTPDEYKKSCLNKDAKSSAPGGAAKAAVR